MRVGSFTIGVAGGFLVLLLVLSAIIGALLIIHDISPGDMEDKWVYRNLDSYGNERLVGPGAYIDSKGTIIVDDWTGFSAIDSNGTLLWRANTNARPSIVEGPDGAYYYQDWNTSDPSLAEWCKITTLDANGDHRWDYVTPNGTLELWGIYPDGQVIVHHHNGKYNDTSDAWVTTTDRIIAISNAGSELWSMDMPTMDTPWGNPRVSDNGTFEVIAAEGGSNHVVGITKDGSLAYIVEGDYYVYPLHRPSSMNGTTAYEVRKEAIDNETSAITVYAVSMLDGSVEWETLLHYSDNPDHIMPGGYQLSWVIVDDEGRLFCDDMDGKYSYSLNSSGAILWKKHFLGSIVDIFPSGGLLAWDDYSIKKINPDGSVALRHYAEHDGNSFIRLGSDETVYYSFGAEVHALIPSSGQIETEVFPIILVVVDVVAVASYGLIHMLRSRRANRS